jgi:Nitrate reductase delta subunit
MVASETLRALAALMEPPGPELEPIADALDLGELASPAEHVELFSFELPPFASIWLSPEGMLGGDARAWVGSFWRTLDQESPKEPDHLTTLLSFYASLTELSQSEDEGSERRERIHASRCAFFSEHMQSWLPLYVQRVQDVSELKGLEFYITWSALLGKLLAQEAKALGAPATLPQHYDRRSELPAEPTVAELIRLLLAPLGSGLPLLRNDLKRCADALGLVARQAERRYVLEQLLTQDARSVLFWLAKFAEHWADRHQELWPAPLAGFWSSRASGMGELLSGMQALESPAE